MSQYNKGDSWLRLTALISTKLNESHLCETVTWIPQGKSVKGKASAARDRLIVPLSGYIEF